MASPEERETAFRELDQLTAEHHELRRRVEENRQALADAIVRHLKSRTLRPVEVTDHSPYKYAHVTRIARAGGVPPFTEPTGVSKRKAGQEN